MTPDEIALVVDLMVAEELHAAHTASVVAAAIVSTLAAAIGLLLVGLVLRYGSHGRWVCIDDEVGQ